MKINQNKIEILKSFDLELRNTIYKIEYIRKTNLKGKTYKSLSIKQEFGKRVGNRMETVKKNIIFDSSAIPSLIEIFEKVVEKK